MVRAGRYVCVAIISIGLATLVIAVATSAPTPLPTPYRYPNGAIAGHWSAPQPWSNGHAVYSYETTEAMP